MEKRYDVIICGAGPCGSLLGYLLACEGISTLIVEKKDFPRYKTCAGGLQHRILGLIPFKIDDVIHRTIYGVRFSMKTKDSFIKKHCSPIMHTVDRAQFDNFLAKKAHGMGADISFGEELTGYCCSEREVRVTTTKGSYSCRVLAGADGARGYVHRQLNDNGGYLRILGYEVEKGHDFTRGDYFNDCASLDFGGVKSGYCWIFPKKNMLSCGVGGPPEIAADLRFYLKKYMENNFNGNAGERKNIMAQSIPIRRQDTLLNQHRVLTVGDAACLGDGFTGEGLYNGLRSSIIASKAIKNALKFSRFDFDGYAEDVEREIYSDIKISLRF
ncbi:MAG: geranylgeranyl reductase family protein, partial [Actinobacteria bacterium]|nr:geranylgeranyl reductase family protein [Actinomycetota bacterium]